jgi:hypothetical protein
LKETVMIVTLGLREVSLVEGVEEVEGVEGLHLPAVGWGVEGLNLPAEGWGVEGCWLI